MAPPSPTGRLPHDFIGGTLDAGQGDGGLGSFPTSKQVKVGPFSTFLPIPESPLHASRFDWSDWLTGQPHSLILLSLPRSSLLKPRAFHGYVTCPWL